ncbi:MAG: EAL domain-containing protein [Candidatus Competibacteraceae bacterium]|nr:EAL domain-containing protein [Candidatus Competibacteraceae bacterium]
MSDPSDINLLIVDRSRSDIDRVVKTLQDDNYRIELIEADAVDQARNAIDYRLLDLILLRLDETLPAIAEMRLMVAEAHQDIPIIAMVDQERRQQHKPAWLLEQGADNYFYLEDADHLAAAVRKELAHLRARKQGHSFETRFKETETRVQALLENTQEAVAYIHEGVHIYANPAYLQLFGYERKEDLANIQLVHMVPPTYRDALKSILRRSIRSGKAVEPVELVGLRSNGKNIPIMLECAPTRMNDEPCTQIIVRDATPESNTVNQQQLEDLLKHDDATGLYSRRFFMETLEIDHEGSVLYVLLTDYAPIRHAMGFEAVEQFVSEVALLIKNLLSHGDIAAHFASGVLTIFLPAGSPNDAVTFAGRICSVVAEHSFQLGSKMFTTTCCIGICRAKDGQETAIQILSHADRACELARQKGGNRVEIYTPPSTEKKSGVINPQDEPIIRLIRNALTKGQLGLHYQPIVSFAAAEDARYKVYLQVMDEEGKPQPIEKVGAVAVRYGAMGAMDKWTLIRALSVLAEIRQDALKPPILFVRISRNSIVDKQFFDWMSKAFKDSRVPGQHLVLEIKEDNVEDCFEEVKYLRGRLRELGCGLALSHFGGKAHSDRLLRDLTPDYIKLDGSLIERLAKSKDENSRRAMATLSEQAQQLKVRVVASGVSTAPQMASIWQFGVTLVQGNMVAEAGPRLDFDFRQYAS